MTDSSLTSEQFRRACGQWATGVSIVTTVDKAGKPYGLTMNAVTSLSLNPPMFIACVDNNSDTLGPMRESQVYCINVLTSAQQDLSNRFAKKGDEKFAGVDFAPGETGAPVLAGALLAIECVVTAVLPGGDHQIMCGEVRRIVSNDTPDAAPLLYFGGRYAAVAKA